MKKFFMGLALFASVTAFAVVADIRVNDLNKEIKNLLAEFQNADTQVEVVFADIKTDATRTLNFSVSGFLAKKGPANYVNLVVQPLSYDYGNGTSPKAQVLASLGTDLSKLITQVDFNEMVPDIEKTIEELAKDFTQEFGAALTIDAKVTDKSQDAQGNYTTVKGHIDLAIDHSKLPPELKTEDVPVTAARLDVDLTFKQGVSLGLKLALNPKFKGFNEDEKGMKEYLDKLLAQDPELMDRLKGWIRQVDSFATDLANRQ